MDSELLDFVCLKSAIECDSEELFGLFREAGFMFDVFIPTKRRIGGSRGFGFVCFKTKWDVNKAISLLNGHLVGGKRIYVQKAKHDNRNKGSNVAINWKVYKRSVLGVFRSRNFRYVSSALDKRDAWIVKEGSLQVVKVLDCMSLELKKMFVILL